MANIFKSWPPKIHKPDFFILTTVVGLLLFGLVMVYSSSFIYAHERFADGFWFIKRQIVFAGIGVLVMMVASQLDYQIWSKWSVFLLGLAMVLLLTVILPGLGSKVGGAQRWFKLGYFSFQPGELAKLAVVIFAARQLTRKQDRIQVFAAGTVSPLLFTVPILVLLLFQPDFGTAVMIFLVVFALQFSAGVPKRHLFLVIGAAIGMGYWLVASSPYRMARVTSFMNPWEDPFGKGFQILQSLVGISNGKFFGIGLGNGKEKLFFLPEAHSDFIFAVIGEEMGFLGVIAVTTAFAFLTYHGFKIAKNVYLNKKDTFGFLLATGITLMLAIQVFINMGVVLGILPTKGLSLPFISYGGSGLIFNLLGIGILLSISKESVSSSRVRTA